MPHTIKLRVIKLKRSEELKVYHHSKIRNHAGFGLMVNATQDI